MFLLLCLPIILSQVELKWIYFDKVNNEALCTVLPGMAHSSSTNVALVRSVGSLLRGVIIPSVS